MKFITALIICTVLIETTSGQQLDTVKIFDYLKPGESWKLVLRNETEFALQTNTLFSKDTDMIRGEYLSSDTTIQLICDASNFKFNFLLSDYFLKISNIPYLVNGDTFKRENNLLIPKNFTNETEELPKGLFAKYYRGNGFGSHTIEINKDKTYRFTQGTCMSRDSEQGTWMIKNNIITLSPKNKKWTMLNWVTTGNRFYIENNYLIGLKTMSNKSDAPLTQTYFYFAKLPKVLSE